jgi:iron transport multicopper oxidase
MGNDSFNPAVYGHQTNAIPYPHGANIQLTVYNWDDGFHPFHFHGYVLLLFLYSFGILPTLSKSFFVSPHLPFLGLPELPR